jgi:hypothetical protein
VAPARKTLEDLLAEVAGGDFLSVFRSTFALIEAAEEETERACAGAYAAGDEEGMRRIWNVGLQALQPRVCMSEPLYRVHVRELLERAALSERPDLRSGTRAEVLLAISTATFASRLDRDVESLALTIASEAWPEKAEDFGAWPESYPGRHAELLREFRRKTASPDRVMLAEREIPGRTLERIREAAV